VQHFQPISNWTLLLRCAALCCAAPRCAVLCCAALCCAVLCCAVLCCAVLCCAVLCCAVLCCEAMPNPCPCSACCPRRFVGAAIAPVAPAALQELARMLLEVCLFVSACPWCAAVRVGGWAGWCVLAQAASG
jgi:hypothetical protein